MTPPFAGDTRRRQYRLVSVVGSKRIWKRGERTRTRRGFGRRASESRRPLQGVALRVDGRATPRRVASFPLPSLRSRHFSLCFSLSPSPRLTAVHSDRLITFLQTIKRRKSTLAYALISFLRPALFSMSTTRALLPRPATSYAPHVVAVGLRKLLCTSHSHHWGISTRVADGIERRESRRRRRKRRRRRTTTWTSCDWVGGVAPASLR